jgi:glycine oxidase
VRDDTGPTKLYRQRNHAVASTYIGRVVQHSSDVIVVGGGIIGLSAAFQLARRGHRVAVIDDQPGGGASFAAAGMLAPGAESSPEHERLTAITLRARRMWPEFAEQLAESSGTDVRLHEVGSLFVAWNAGDHQEVDRYLTVAHAHGISSRPIDRHHCPEPFNGLSDRIRSGTLVPDDAYVDPDAVIKALLDANRSLGVNLIRSEVVSCTSNESEVEVVAGQDRYGARCGIVATGVHRVPLDLVRASTNRLRPIRGVTLRLRTLDQDRRPMIRGVVNGRPVYVIRRSDGSVVIGASSDESPTLDVESGVLRRLLDDATVLVPGLEHASFVDARVGLRPATNDHLPFFEELPARRWAWSGGHFRHGYLLAPLSATDAVNFVEGQLA